MVSERIGTDRTALAPFHLTVLPEVYRRIPS
jgi:hypothetical protein